MINPDSNKCKEPGDSCFNKLQWLSDWSLYQNKSGNYETHVRDGARQCIILKEHGQIANKLKAEDKKCDNEEKFVCQFDCNRGDVYYTS